MKKILTVAMATVVAAGLMVGCGNGGSKPSEPAGSSSGSASASASGSETPSNSGGDSGEYVDSLGDVKASDRYKVGFSMPVRDQFLSYMETAAKEEGAHQGIELITVDANNNANTQVQNVQTFVSQGCKAIIVGLVNTDSAQQIIDAARGVQVVFVNRRPTLTLEAGKAAYVGSDERNAGKFEGEFLAKWAKDNGKSELNVVMLQGVLGLESVIARTDSAYKALEEAGIKVNKVYEDTAEWDRAKAQNKMQTFLGANKPFDVVISNNDEMALGAIAALKAAGKDLATIPVVGIDATPDALNSIEAGEMAFSVFQNPVGQGKGAVRAAVLFAEGKDVPTNIDIPFEPVDKSNYKEYKK